MLGSSEVRRVGTGILSRHRTTLVAILVLFAVAIIFTAMMPTRPVFSENQNTKFLYGLAKAGYGFLQSDWLISQGSNLPIFDGLVFVTQKFLGAGAFYLWQIAANATYLFALMALIGTVSTRLDIARDWRRPEILVAATVILGLLHSTSATALMFEGVANQYITSWVFEPASFGVLALVAVVLLRHRQAGWGATLLAVAAWMHPVYAIPGLMILSGYAVAVWRFEGLSRLPVLPLAAGAVGCLGAAAFTYSLLFPVDPAVQREAVRIITEIRIPQHSWPAVWFDFDAFAKSAAVLLAVWLTRRDMLGWILGTAALLAVAMTLWVELTHDLNLALAAPWRVSAIIVPAANCILLAKALDFTLKRVSLQDLPRAMPGLILGVLALVGLGSGFLNRIEDESWNEPSYLDWVRANVVAGDLYLTPIEEDEFRLSTGAPLYVNWKTHPHRGEGVLEWYRRIGVAKAATENRDCAALDQAAAEGVTHIVREDPTGMACRGWRTVYDDADHVVLAHDRRTR